MSFYRAISERCRCTIGHRHWHDTDTDGTFDADFLPRIRLGGESGAALPDQRGHLRNENVATAHPVRSSYFDQCRLDRIDDEVVTMPDPRNRLCVALDGSDRDWIVSTARELGPRVGWLKLGLEAFTAFGPSLVEEMATSCRVFLDVKLHDIPNTVRRAAANCSSTGAAMFNVHAAGGRAMLAAAVEGAREGAAENPPLVIAVTVLTSLDGETLSELGLPDDPEILVVRWARLARDAGLDGVVASAREAATIRTACGDDFLIVTPGIRPSWSATGDQKRIMTPAEAVGAGADVLVVGRPITGATDPREAAERILGELSD